MIFVNSNGFVKYIYTLVYCSVKHWNWCQQLFDLVKTFDLTPFVYIYGSIYSKFWHNNKGVEMDFSQNHVEIW